ncbi:MAG TPA: tetratricopeptide repeat protein [bacterium]|nr:tetratricopeptide repeat protein [bacterium]
MRNPFRAVPVWVLLLLAFFPASPSRAATPDAYYNAGNLYLHQGHYDKAVPYFRAVLNLDPNHALAYEGLAECYYRLGQYDQAYEACQKGLVLYPESAMLQAINQRLGPRMAKPPMPVVQGPGKVVQGGRVIQEGPMLAPQFWVKGALKYDYSFESDFNQAVNGWKTAAPNNGATVYDASAGNSGFGGKMEFGYGLDAWDGLTLTLSAFAEDGFHGTARSAAPATLTSDFNPLVTAVEADYCLFWPHDDYRFYIKGGFGYYYSFIGFQQRNQPVTTLWGNLPGTYSGTLGSGDFGLNLGGGYELRLEDHLGLELSILARYATLSQFTVNGPKNPDGSTPVYGLISMPDGFIGVADTATINNTTHNKFLTMDLTGVEVALSLDYYFF